MRKKAQRGVLSFTVSVSSKLKLLRDLELNKLT